MPYYTFKCTKCKVEEMRHIMQEEDLTWEEEVIVKELTQEEIDKLPAWDDPRDYVEIETINYGKELPEVVKCSKCKGKSKFVPPSDFTIKHGKNSYHALKERRRYAIEGMDKKQAEQFYKESIQASKERVKSGGESHYKKIVPVYDELAKQGVVKKVNDQQRANKIEGLKRANQHLTKDGMIGKGPRKHR